MNAHDAQRAIARAVQQRGYWDGYTPSQVASRQALKAVEEMVEAVGPLMPWLPGELRGLLQRAGDEARRLFDQGWAVDMSESQMRAMLMEMADVLVTLANAATAYEEATGVEYDLMAEAVAKAEADIPRGVRGRE